MKRTIFSILTLLVLSTIGGYDLVTFNAVATGTLATPRMDGNYQTWHLPDGAIARLGKGGIVAVAFSSADQRLIVASEIGVWLYDVATFRELALLPTESRVGAFSPDGTILALFPFNGRVMKLWDAATGTNIATLEGHTGGVYSAAFSPDGTTLASGSWDSTVKLWDVATGTNTATLEGHTGGATSVSFSPDGTTLASGSEDGEVKLWDVATKQNTATLEGHTGGVSSVSFSPDGTTLASGSEDGTVTLWDMSPYITPIRAPESLTGDVNQDGVVNILDLVLVASNLGQTGQNAGDVNGDGVVNILDLVKVAGALGNAAAAPSLYPRLRVTLPPRLQRGIRFLWGCQYSGSCQGCRRARQRCRRAFAVSTTCSLQQTCNSGSLKHST